jgi:arylsulfate sulfotransferase
VVLSAFCLLGASPEAWSLVVTTPPTVTLNPTGLAPLAARLDLTTDVPARVTVGVTGAGEAWGVVFPAYETTHALPIVGLKADRAYTVRVTVVDQRGQSLVLDPALDVVTAPLPADFPAISVLVSDPLRMEPGFTLLDRFRRGGGGLGESYTMIVDQGGEVVWYAPVGGSAMLQLPSGRLRFRSGERPGTDMVAVRDLDLFGDFAQTIPLADPGKGLHHDLYPTAKGTFLSLSSETAVVSGYPTSLTDPGAPTQTASIEDDPVVEFAADGSLLHRWPLTNLIDPTRVGFGALDVNPVGLDWAHANAVIDDPADDSILVSVRHQDAIVKFSRAGQLKWILGPHDNWSAPWQPFLLDPVGAPFSWQWHEHAQMITPAGTLLLFDNGNYRASPFDGTVPMAAPDSYSRAVEYAIDERQMTVQQVWEYSPQGADRLYSASRGDADWMPTTGNVLITYSAVAYLGGTASCTLGLGGPHTRVLEVDHEASPQKVFELAIYDPNRAAAPCPQIGIYRSDRIPTLYAASATVLQVPGLSVVPASNLVRRGRTLSYVGSATNDAGTTQCYDSWANITLADGNKFPASGELRGPFQVCLDPHATQSRTILQPIPAATPIGTYTYNVFVGSYPLVLSESHFQVRVAP